MINMDALNQTLEQTGFEQVSHRNKASGQWVWDDTLEGILDQVKDVQTRHCIIKHSTGFVHPASVDDSVRALNERSFVLVKHVDDNADNGIHFSCMFIADRRVYAFDTIDHVSTSRLRERVETMFPNVSPDTFVIFNFTGVVVQKSPAGCGPLSLWILVACVFNFDRLMDGGTIRVAKLNEEDAMAFWNKWTKP